jgi:hypothetical protein
MKSLAVNPSFQLMPKGHGRSELGVRPEGNEQNDGQEEDTPKDTCRIEEHPVF